MKLWHFYHAYAQENEEDIWLPIVTDHVNALHSSGITSKLNKTYIGVVGSENSAEKISTMFSAKGVNNEICAISDRGWEQLTLNKLYEFSLKNDGYVLYTHTKGAFYQSKGRDNQRIVMNKHLIERWSENIDLLSQGYCATGIFFLRGSPYSDHSKECTPMDNTTETKHYLGFFAGNFWWCNLDFIKEMGYPSMEDRIKAESWMNNLYYSTDSSKYMVYDLLPGKFSYKTPFYKVF
jgi:hypothetical protein